MPDAVSIAAVGRAFDIVGAPDGVALEDADGNIVDREIGGNRLAAAAALWKRVSAQLDGPARATPPATGAVAVGGFAYRVDRDPAGPWSGFPALLLRVPALAVTRVRGRTYVTTAVEGALDLLETAQVAPTRAPAARTLEVSAVRNPIAWAAAVDSAAARLRSGEAEKVVLAREVVAHGDGVVSAGAVARSLRSAYPSCFTYLMTGSDGTAFAGASPELLIRRTGASAFAQPMAGSVAR